MRASAMIAAANAASAVVAVAASFASWTPTPVAQRYMAVSYSPWFDYPVKWSQTGGCTWGNAALGAYKSSSKAVLRQHAEWLRDAHVHFVLVDWSNDIAYEPLLNEGLDRTDLKAIEENTHVMFEVWSKVPGSPKIAIMSGSPANKTEYESCCHETKTKSNWDCGKLTTKGTQIMRWFVANESAAIREMFFKLDGKPLLVDYVGTPAFFQTDVGPFKDERFTLKHLTGFVSEQQNLWKMDALGQRVSRLGYWSWGECAHKREGRGTKDSTFKSKWKYARQIGPRIALVQSFNQWAGCEQNPREIMNQEYSTDIEPQASTDTGSHGDLFLSLLQTEAAAFKGIWRANRTPHETSNKMPAIIVKLHADNRGTPTPTAGHYYRRAGVRNALLDIYKIYNTLTRILEGKMAGPSSGRSILSSKGMYRLLCTDCPMSTHCYPYMAAV